MRVSVYVCTFGDAVTYAGIAENPYRAVAKLMLDGSRDVPVTECGKAIKDQIQDLPCPSLTVLTTCSLRKALRKLREYVEKHNVISEYNYSLIDDDDFSHKPYVKTVYRTPYPQLVYWGTDDATLALEEQFFTTDEPHKLLEGSLCDIMVNVFRELLVVSRSPLGHCMTYVKNTRSVLIRTQQYPFVETHTMYRFCIMAVGWLATSLEYVFSRILSGCRNDANPTYDVERTMQLAFEAYRLMHTIEGNKTWLESVKQPCSVRVQLTQAFGKCLVDFSLSPEFVRVSFEKMRRIYPEDHPQSPSFQRYRKRLLALHGEQPIKLASIDNHLKEKPRRITHKSPPKV